MSFVNVRLPTTETEHRASRRDQSRWDSGSARPSTSLEPADLGLVLAIQAGDSAAVTPLYGKLRPKIAKALRRVLKESPHEMDDLIQITFERVVRNISNGAFEGRSQLDVWAGAIATHVAIDWLRKRTCERRMFSAIACMVTDPMGLQARPERRLEARAELRSIQRILSRMKPQRANVLLLHDVLGHSVPQVAQLLGMSVSGTQSLLRRAHHEFRRRYRAMVSSTIHRYP